MFPFDDVIMVPDMPSLDEEYSYPRIKLQLAFELAGQLFNFNVE